MTKLIPLTQNQFAIVDEEDYDQLKKMKWYAVHTHGYERWYVYHSLSSLKKVALHRLLLGLKEGEQCDHINGNGLDNRRSNLRLVTNAQNQMNCRRSRRSKGSRFKGVTKLRAGICRRKKDKWQAQIKIEKRQLYLGLFSDEVQAAKVYDSAAKQLFGDFAHLNFPELEDYSGGLTA